MSTLSRRIESKRTGTKNARNFFTTNKRIKYASTVQKKRLVRVVVLGCSGLLCNPFLRVHRRITFRVRDLRIARSTKRNTQSSFTMRVHLQIKAQVHARISPLYFHASFRFFCAGIVVTHSPFALKRSCMRDFLKLAREKPCGVCDKPFFTRGTGGKRTTVRVKQPQRPTSARK